VVRINVVDMDGYGVACLVVPRSTVYQALGRTMADTRPEHHHQCLAEAQLGANGLSGRTVPVPLNESEDVAEPLDRRRQARIAEVDDHRGWCGLIPDHVPPRFRGSGH
jgi:hypothetical protein